MRHATSRLGILAITCAVSALAAAQPVSTGWTYQGQLKDAGAPAVSDYDMLFVLHDAVSGGSQVGPLLTFDGNGGNPPPVAIVDGLFTVELDFGAGVFTGDALWLQVAVRPTGVGQYTTLDPRQPLTAAPYALYALNGPGSSGYWDLNGVDIHNNNSGNVGIGTTSPQHLLHVVGDAGTAHAIYGRNTDTVSASAGVYGESNSTRGYGVFGFGAATTGTNSGVYGRINSAIGRGVYGRAALGSGNSYGVLGQSQSTSGTGVYGWASSSTGNTIGVLGRSNSPTGFAGRFEGRGFFSGNVGFAVPSPQYPVHAQRNSGTAIYGEGLWDVEGVSLRPDGRGVFGFAASLTSDNYGVYGLTASTRGRAVHGYATNTSGPTVGVSGQTDSDEGFGIYGYATAATGATNGVYGRADSPDGRGVTGSGAAGVFGTSGGNQDGRGVYGIANSASGTTYGVYGKCFSEDGYGVFGLNEATNGDAIGVYGRSDGVVGIGLFGVASSANGIGAGVVGRGDSPNGYDFFAAGVGVDYGASSSRRWKTNIQNIDHPLKKIAQLRGVYFDWDDEWGPARCGHDRRRSRRSSARDRAIRGERYRRPRHGLQQDDPAVGRGRQRTAGREGRGDRRPDESFGSHGSDAEAACREMTAISISGAAMGLEPSRGG